MADRSRPDWMSVLAKAPPASLKARWEAAGLAPDFAYLRPPECGSVMVRGRTGGTGAPFNLGEITVTRCVVSLAAGGIAGHATVPGRDREHARIAALADALMQTAEAPRIEAGILAPLAAEAAAAARLRAAKAEATKVDFFTMVRGEDE
jgi:alpha-D-ribose 1-methylphosphonate 5-triphosphate synthase subunit PhnG